MRSISRRGGSGEIHRDKLVRRLYRADLVDDGCRLDAHDYIAAERRPFRSIALRLASLAVRVRHLHDCALHDRAHGRYALRSRWLMSMSKQGAKRRKRP